jgi:hypothetical protein
MIGGRLKRPGKARSKSRTRLSRNTLTWAAGQLGGSNLRFHLTAAPVALWVARSSLARRKRLNPTVRLHKPF